MEKYSFFHKSTKKHCDCPKTTRNTISVFETWSWCFINIQFMCSKIYAERSPAHISSYFLLFFLFICFFVCKAASELLHICFSFGFSKTSNLTHIKYVDFGSQVFGQLYRYNKEKNTVKHTYIWLNDNNNSINNIIYFDSSGFHNSNLFSEHLGTHFTLELWPQPM